MVEKKVENELVMNAAKVIPSPKFLSKRKQTKKPVNSEQEVYFAS